MNQIIKQHPLHDDSAASVAATPARKSLKDFFPKISSDDHWKVQDDLISALTQADIMDLRNAVVGAVRATKRRAIRTPLALQSKEGPEFDDDDDEDDDAEEEDNSSNDTPPRQDIVVVEKVDEEDEVELKEDDNEEQDEEADAEIEGQEEENDGNRKPHLYSTLTADDFQSFRSFL